MWHVELDRVWDVLGPFSIHAREQHFVSPAYPIDLSLPIDTTRHHPTSLAPGDASWSQITADPQGTLRVSHPTVPWDQIRATEGWAGLQHVNVLRGWLSVHPPIGDTPEPLLCTKLIHGAFFTLLPPDDSSQRRTHVPEWHYGNIYALDRAPVQLVRLPVPPARNRKETRYEVIICAPYEIRLFGDPLSYSSSHPILTLEFSIALQFPCPVPPLHVTDTIKDAPLQQMLAHSVTPSIVDGTPFGGAIGIGIQCLDFGRHTEQGQGCWSVIRACLAPGSVPLPPSVSVTLLDDTPIRIVPSQTRIVPLQLRIASSERIPEHVRQLIIDLTCVPSFLCQATAHTLSHMHGNPECDTQNAFVLRTTLPLTHVPLWTEETHVPIRASYFFAKSMPTTFVVKPPKEAIGESQAILGRHDRIGVDQSRGTEPILALHGAGVDICSQSFWPDSLPRQKYAWVVMPQGLTAWGLDWHGPSAADAFATVSALSHILSSSSSGRWAKWGFSPRTRVILVGHSNGGQGAWYMASRWPDRMRAVIPAAGYIKSQAYVTWCMSHFAHFVDPALRAVLDSSLTPDDNDLFLGNLVGKPVLALHGGADNNVPTWHTREQVEILKTWDLYTDVTYHEDPGQPHWYSEILCNERVQAFLDRVYFSSPLRSIDEAPGTTKDKRGDFTLTVAVPAESGPLNGWQIHTLTIPGLLGRLHVTTTFDGNISIRTVNVSVFSLDSIVWAAARGDIGKVKMLIVDDDTVQVDLANSNDTILFVRNTNVLPTQPKSPWQIRPCPDPSTADMYRLCATPRRLQSILTTHAPLTLLVPSLAPSPELSAALRIAHALFLFHTLDAQIISITEVDTPESAPYIHIQEGNLVVIGCADTPLVRKWLQDGLWSYADGAWHVGTTRLDRPSSAILFCQPHPYDVGGTALFVQSTDPSGLERAVRLFPIRTGVLSPDWLVVDGRAGTIGAAGVQGAGVYGWRPPTPGGQGASPKWHWNERMSWLD